MHLNRIGEVGDTELMNKSLLVCMEQVLQKGLWQVGRGLRIGLDKKYA